VCPASLGGAFFESAIITLWAAANSEKGRTTTNCYFLNVEIKVLL
jgi:hypothetical protein